MFSNLYQIVQLGIVVVGDGDRKLRIITYADASYGFYPKVNKSHFGTYNTVVNDPIFAKSASYSDRTSLVNFSIVITTSSGWK